MITWATTQQLETWLGATPPDSAEVLLRRASQLVTRATRNAVWDVGSNGSPTDEDVSEALRDATCAQAQAWIVLGIDPLQGSAAASSGVIQTRTLGSASITYAAPSASAVDARARAASALSGEAMDILLEAGLITAAVGTW